ncbi:hypothetical protein IMZ48_01160 [Candidatus Bathyarchaeota archaeon]|nr:hypothetical protein [Candidatus Bathyarchaeota archaeon]
MGAFFFLDFFFFFLFFFLAAPAAPSAAGSSASSSESSSWSAPSAPLAPGALSAAPGASETVRRGLAGGGSDGASRAVLLPWGGGRKPQGAARTAKVLHRLGGSLGRHVGNGSLATWVTVGSVAGARFPIRWPNFEAGHPDGYAAGVGQDSPRDFRPTTPTDWPRVGNAAPWTRRYDTRYITLRNLGCRTNARL